MSAYLCESHLFGYLGQYAAKHCKYSLSFDACEARFPGLYQNILDHAGESAALAACAAVLLADENLRSLSVRYGEEQEDREFILDCAHSAVEHVWLHVEPREVISAAQCLDYQSCESDDYDKTEAYKIIRSIVWHAAGRLRSDTWGAPKPNPNAVPLTAIK